MSLNWESTYAIALELQQQHPDAELEGLTLQQLKEWIFALSEFDDDPSLVNDDILMAIFQEWFEENLNGKK